MLATLIYIPYSRSSAQGASGGSVLGLTYGSIGSAFMLFAGALGLRKKFPIWRVGRAQAWMRGHLWLGTLGFPLILFHAGFHFGVGLTKALMWMFVVVFVSGIVGAVLQHYMPRFNTERIPMETIYEQIGRVRSQLVEEASRLVKDACATLAGSLSARNHGAACGCRRGGHHGRPHGRLRPAGGPGSKHAAAKFLSSNRCSHSSSAADRAGSPWPTGCARKEFFAK